MGIESQMQALTEALNNHTAALNAFVKAGAKGGSTASASTSTKTESAGTTKPAADKKKKGITLEQVQEKFGGYLKVTDKAERAERLANVQKINAHFGVSKISEAEASEWPEAFQMLDKFIAGEDPFEDEGEEGDEGESPV